MVASHRSSSAHLASPAPTHRERRLYLVVDNTIDNTIGPVARRPLPRSSAVQASAVADVSAIDVPLPTVDDLWLSLEVAFRRWRLHVTNRLGSFGVSTDIVAALPALILAAAVVFGSLIVIRTVQGESGGALVAEAEAPAVGSSIIVVAPGDSLWLIATEHFPEEDARRVVDLLVAANGGAAIQAGQQLVVPAELAPTQ